MAKATEQDTTKKTKETKDSELVEITLSDKDLEKLKVLDNNERVLQARSLTVLRDLIVFMRENDMAEQQKNATVKFISEKFEIPEKTEYQINPDTGVLSFKRATATKSK